MKLTCITPAVVETKREVPENEIEKESCSAGPPWDFIIKEEKRKERVGMH